MVLLKNTLEKWESKIFFLKRIRCENCILSEGSNISLSYKKFLITEQLDTKFYNHSYVSDSTEVISKIKEYHQLGFEHVKVYSLMEETALKTAIRIAGELDMNIFGHIENSLCKITFFQTI